MWPPKLEERITSESSVQSIAQGWRFNLKPGDGRLYQLAQMDDYVRLPRHRFSHKPPVILELSARASHKDSPGTWGFGFWNDPGPMLSFKPFFTRLPVLPNAAWFFFAAQLNHLSLRDHQPGTGRLVGVYSSPRVPSIPLAFLVLLTPLIFFRPGSRWLRSKAAKIVRHELSTFETNPTEWRRYRINWQADRVYFEIDGELVFQTGLNPKPPLALVLWLDNQYGAWRPDGGVGYGMLPVPTDCWIEVKDLYIGKG